MEHDILMMMVTFYITIITNDMRNAHTTHSESGHSMAYVIIQHVQVTLKFLLLRGFVGLFTWELLHIF